MTDLTPILLQAEAVSARLIADLHRALLGMSSKDCSFHGTTMMSPPMGWKQNFQKQTRQPRVSADIILNFLYSLGPSNRLQY